MVMLKKLAHLALQNFLQFAVVIFHNEQSTFIKIYAFDLIFSSLGDLSESVSHSLSSAFRPVIFKSYERDENFGAKKSENQNCNSPETGCSEVSTTVDKDEPSGEETGKEEKYRAGKDQVGKSIQ